MPSIYKLSGTEQTFTTGNTFSGANSTQIAGWNIVRVVNVSNAVVILSVNNSSTNTALNANISVLPLSEIIIEKAANTPITAVNANLLGTVIDWKNN